MKKKPHEVAQVRYRVSVLEAGRVVRRRRKKKNLILDQGLNEVAVRPWSVCFQYAAVGTGTTPTRRDSGSVTFTRAGTTVTASAGFFEAADVGRLLKFDSGEEMYITVYTDPTTVTVSESGTLGASEGTVWYVNQTALTSESKRTGTYSSDGGANGATFDGVSGTWTLKRTFIFAAEISTVNYREIGWSWQNVAGPNLFGRDLLAGSGVTLVSGQQLKVEVELDVTFTPQSSTPWVNVISGWSQDGVHGIETCRIGTVATNGGGNGPDLLDPAGGGCIGVSAVSVAINPMGTADFSLDSYIERKALALDAYVSGSFVRTRSATFTVNEANSSAIRSIALVRGIGSGASERTSYYRVLLAAAETKDSNHTLKITFAISWGRELVN